MSLSQSQSEEVQFQKIDKLSAARRQLAQGIRLFFFEGDDLAVHSIAAAAQGILHDLGLKRGAFSLKSPPFMTPELRKRWINMIHEAQNFLKHADQSPDAILDYNERQTYFLILDAIFLLQQLTGESIDESKVFLAWFYSNYPELLAGEHPSIVEIREKTESKGTKFKDRKGWAKFLQTVGPARAT